jgi:hypothetical protein
LGQSFTLGLWEWLCIDGVLPPFFFLVCNCMDIESKKRNGGKGGVGVGNGNWRKGFVCLLEFGSIADEMSEEGSRKLGDWAFRGDAGVGVCSFSCSARF